MFTYPRNLTLLLGAIAIFILSNSCANVDSTKVSPFPNSPSSSIQESPSKSDETVIFPQELSERVMEDSSQSTGIPTQKMSVLRYSQETWPDGCLGLGKPDELCSMALVDGWQVEVSIADSPSRFYRTDLTGENLRLSSLENNLPPSLRDRILDVASQETGIPITELSIKASQPQEWDGCLGIEPPGAVCTEQLILGWQAVVKSKTQTWVYHSDGSGQWVKLNKEAKSLSAR